MKLREFNFNELKYPFTPTTIAVRMETEPFRYGPWHEDLTIGDTLRMLPPEFSDAEIKNTRWYFNIFIIELENPQISSSQN